MLLYEFCFTEKTQQQGFQYFPREPRMHSRQVDATVTAVATRANGSHFRYPTTDESFSGLIKPQSGMIAHQSCLTTNGARRLLCVSYYLLRTSVSGLDLFVLEDGNSLSLAILIHS
jgi:hypothetical protein